MKSILVGNGLNIEFGGKDYSNSRIIERVITNLQTKDYSNISRNQVSNLDLNNFFNFIYNELKKLLKGKYDSYCITSEEKFTLARIKQQYSITTSIINVGFEDYFFIMRVWHKSFKDPNELLKSTYDSLCFLLLDSIYNDGKIQEINNKIKPSKLKKLYNLFNEFNNIFTVNYDCNIEYIAKKNVYHLHGDFNTLFDQYDPTTHLGKMHAERGSHNPSTTENKHMYSNSLMGFNGPFKESQMNAFGDFEANIENMKQLFKIGLSKEDEERYQSYKYSPDEKLRDIYEIRKIIENFTDLHTNSYHKKIFEDIIDELCIVGLSPNNDEHIWRMLKDNKNLNKITYYYKSEEDKKSVELLYPNMRIITISIDELW